MSDHFIVVGRVVGAHGIKGWVKVLSYTDPMTNVFDYAPWYLQTGTDWQSRRVLESRKQGKALVAHLESVDDRDAALALLGTDIAIRRQQLPKTQENEYYWADLIGLTVRTTLDVSLGHIEKMMETGANDVMVVRGTDRERLVPYVTDQVVKNVDMVNQVVTVDWDPDF